jgi:hypothetical protein
LGKPDNDPKSISFDAPFFGVEIDGLFDKVIDVLAADIPASDEEMDGLLNKTLDALMHAGVLSGSPDEVADAIEPAAPKVAAQVRSLKDAEAVTTYINLLIAVINLILLLSNTFHHTPAPGMTQQIIFNITNVTNPPAPLSHPPVPPG